MIGKNHPNVITVHAVEDFDNIPFVVMEFGEGETVATLLPERRFPAARFFELAIPTASAIAAGEPPATTSSPGRPLRRRHCLRPALGAAPMSVSTVIVAINARFLRMER